MNRFACAILASAKMLPTAATADVQRVTSKGEFVQLVQGRTLSTLGVKLSVSPEGRISGRAWGRDVSGSWRWQDSYFCREMTFGDKPVEADCQVVEHDGDALRFIADRGTGKQANLRLR